MEEVVELRKGMVRERNRFAVGSMEALGRWQEERRLRDAPELQGEWVEAHQHLIWPVPEKSHI